VGNALVDMYENAVIFQIHIKFSIKCLKEYGFMDFYFWTNVFMLFSKVKVSMIASRVSSIGLHVKVHTLLKARRSHI
jgi:hypothetical protein